MKFAALGTLIKKSDMAGTPVFTTIGGVMDISGPGGNRDTIDVTAHDSPGGYEEIVPGVKRTGDVTFDIALDPDDTTHLGATSIHQEFEDGSLTDYTMTLPTTTPKVINFAAYVTGWSYSAPVNGALTVSVTMKPTGALT